MSDLPVERLTVTPPFTYADLDIFGLFKVERNLNGMMQFLLVCPAEQFKFVYPDEDGNLKVRTKDPVGRKFVFSFKSERDIAQLITRISVDNDGFQVLHGDFEEFDNQNNS